MNTSVLVKRPVAFRLPRVDGDRLSTTEWRYFHNEADAAAEAEQLGIDYQGLYVRNGEAITMSQAEALEDAVERMGWPEIHAFQNELRKGQDYREDAGGFMMRAIRRLFGLPAPAETVVTYQEAARAMVAHSKGEG
jgi:hypothetical protein